MKNNIIDRNIEFFVVCSLPIIVAVALLGYLTVEAFRPRPTNITTTETEVERKGIAK